jgi:death on curing protein
MHYLSREDILDLHGYVIERYGGRLGLNSHDRLLSLVASANQTMFGVELYPDLAAKIAALAFALIKNRPFRSGNEATAMLASLRFTEINGYQIDDVAAFAAELRATTRSERQQPELVEWLTEHLVASAAAQPD